MSSEPSKFYLTTPIYYVNARPHLGHTYTTVVCDAIARRQRMLGVDTCFLTGTDEHGQKIERSAAGCGQDAQATGRRSLRQLPLAVGPHGHHATTPSCAPPIRATKPACSTCSAPCASADFIYKGSYTGQYCVFDELYVDAGAGAPCPDCGRPTETVSEENYFFKLSAFEDKLLRLYERATRFHPTGNPPQRSDLVCARRAARSEREPRQPQVGHPGARRSRAGDVRLAGRAVHLHERHRLRLRDAASASASSTTGPPTCT